MKLPADDIARLAVARPSWSVGTERGGTLLRDFRFTDFVQAFEFMKEVAVFAEQKNHHPEWTNVYNRVAVTLTTHDDGGLSMKDFELADFMDQVFARLTPPKH